MSRIPRFLPVLVAAAMAVTLLPGPLAYASSTPKVRISPTTVHIGKTAMVYGSHLRANKPVALVLVAPSGAKPKAAFLFLAKKGKRMAPMADGHGNLKARVKIPVFTRCGRASLLANSGAKSKTGRTSLHLIGCKAKSKNPGLPPPPPKKKR